MNKTALIIILMMSLQGCIAVMGGVVVATIADVRRSEAEYSKYSQKATIETPDDVLSYNEYFKVTYPKCEAGLPCNREEMENKNWDEHWAKQRKIKESEKAKEAEEARKSDSVE